MVMDEQKQITMVLESYQDIVKEELYRRMEFVHS